jgi:hypothetical protein
MDHWANVTSMGGSMTGLRSKSALVACAILGLTGAAHAQSLDGDWTGQITCAKLSFTKGTMKTAMAMKIEKGQATYSRDVFNADGSRIVGNESGTGTVAADGALTLVATWKSAEEKPRYTYTASYGGKFAGGAITLKGTQVWSHDGQTENRACSIALKRKG